MSNSTPSPQVWSPSFSCRPTEKRHSGEHEFVHRNRLPRFPVSCSCPKLRIVGATGVAWPHGSLGGVAACNAYGVGGHHGSSLWRARRALPTAAGGSAASSFDCAVGNTVDTMSNDTKPSPAGDSNDKPNRVWCLTPQLREAERQIQLWEACGEPRKTGDSGSLTLSILRSPAKSVPGR